MQLTRALLPLLLLTFPSTPILAAPPNATPRPKTVSIDVQGADIRGVFQILSEAGGVNIIAHRDVQGSVTMRLNGVGWRDALNAIVRTNNLYAIDQGKVILVIPIDRVRDTLGGADGESDGPAPDETIRRIYRLNNPAPPALRPAP